MGITGKSVLIEKSPKHLSNCHFDREACPSNVSSGRVVSVQLYFPSPPSLYFSLSEEDDKDDEEDDEDEKDLDHQPAVGGD